MMKERDMGKTTAIIKIILGLLALPCCYPLFGLEDWGLLKKIGQDVAVSFVSMKDKCPLRRDSNIDNSIENLVIFGDSLSDTNEFKGALIINPESPFFKGRFSNGPIWNDYLSNCARLRVDNFSQGGAVTKIATNFADELPSYIREVGRSLVTKSVDAFVDEFLEKNHYVIPKADETLFVIWAGANDYLSRFDNSEDISFMIDNPEKPHKGSNAIAKTSAENVAEQIYKLYSAGAKKIVVCNMPDLGVAPTIMTNTSYKPEALSNAEAQYHLSEQLSKITKIHNENLDAKVKEIKNALGDDSLKLVIFDSAKALDNLMNKKGPHGEDNFDYGIDLEKSFKELRAQGKPSRLVGKRCYKGGYLGSNNKEEICNNPEVTLFWDGIHPTTAGHCRIAYLLHSFLNDEGLISYKANFDEYMNMCK